MRFDLTDLRLFLAVAEASSITAGAARAHLSLAAASERIRGMEATSGATLLERGRRGAALTPAGRVLAEHARLVLAQVERLRGELGLYAQGVRGSLRVLANTAAASEMLPQALAGFLAARPQVDLDLEERESADIARAVAAGEAEIGILSAAVDTGTLEVIPWRQDRLVLATPRAYPPGHLFSGRRRIAFAEALDQDFVGLSDGSALQAHLAGHAARAGRELKLRVRLHGLDAVCRMVAAGVGVAVVPETAARRCGAGLALRVLRLSDPWALRRMAICVRRRADLPEHAQALLAHLLAAAEVSAGPESPGAPAASRRPAPSPRRPARAGSPAR